MLLTGSVPSPIVRVLQVYVPHIRAEIPDRRVGRFAAHAVRMMHLPERAELIAREPVEQRAQPRRVGKDALRPQKDRHALRLRRRDERRERRVDARRVVVQRADGNIRALHVVRQLHERCHRPGAVVRGNIARRVEARDRQSPLPQFARRRRGGIFVQRAAASDHRRIVLYVIKLDAAEAHRFGHLYLFFPRDVRPAAGGK